jgi:hypothetical protein
MNKRTFLKHALWSAGAAFATLHGLDRPAVAQNDNQLDADSLKRVLRCKTPAEEAFIDLVFEKVEEGTLPLKYVYMAYRYAVKKSRSRYYYFVAAIQKIARARGISLR